MIRPEELRLGNVIILLGKDYNHDHISPDPEGNEIIIVDAETIRNAVLNIYDYNALPINYEILKDGFGFETEYDSYFTKKINPNGEWQFELISSNTVRVTNNHAFFGIYDYVHQIQNIFFAVEGYELEIKIPETI